MWKRTRLPTKEALVPSVLAHFLQIPGVVMRAPLAVLSGSRKLYLFTSLKNPACLSKIYLGNHLEGQKNNDIKNANSYNLRYKCVC